MKQVKIKEFFDGSQVTAKAVRVNGEIIGYNMQTESGSVLSLARDGVRIVKCLDTVAVLCQESGVSEFKVIL